ncbi:hypothetical protein PPL_01819 [Heterostelium album PN500]|uniref:Ankyrin repeat protein n=1 Tax=Heterostelium pallidum (strain ATCC 26659 / Pp 5 / PN500) TaxID=670386 RepID=D3B0K2_HETP5|nr:hypothetical protein PPL_01819 [Heterostelium album PN500]EFA84826.1 hypothetical protein PPL_01819 [Heterostelium album PN500]|eukprot:XP_020436937.1 hypothetical protein PPL_01819 [Heterostelium album PN500]
MAIKLYKKWRDINLKERAAQKRKKSGGDGVMRNNLQINPKPKPAAPKVVDKPKKVVQPAAPKVIEKPKKVLQPAPPRAPSRAPQPQSYRHDDDDSDDDYDDDDDDDSDDDSDDDYDSDFDDDDDYYDDDDDDFEDYDDYNLIYSNVKDIHCKLKLKSFNWSELLQLPRQLAYYQYFDELKEFLVVNKPKSIGDFTSTLLSAIKYDRLDIFKWCIDNMVSIHSINHSHLPFDKLMRESTRYGRLDILKYLDSIDRFSHQKSTITDCYVLSPVCGNLDVVQWFEQTYYITWRNNKDRDSAAGNAANYGQLDILKYFVESSSSKSKLYIPSSVVSSAIKGCHMNILMYLHENGVELNGPTHLLDTLIMFPENIDSVKFILEHGNIRIGWIAFTNSIRTGDLEFVKYLLAKLPPREFRLHSVDIAADLGYLHIVTYLYEQFKMVHPDAISISNAIEYASSNGHLEVIKWIHNNTTLGCSHQAMDMAAKNNHLHVLQWLFENRAEGCSKKALINALSNNNIEVSKWLHANCTTHSEVMEVHEVIKNDHLEAFQFLHAIRLTKNLDIDNKDLQLVCRWGSIRILKYIHSYYKDNQHNQSSNNTVFTSNLIDIAAEEGWIEVVRFLLDNRTEGFNQQALNNAAFKGHLSVLQLLISHKEHNWTNSTLYESLRNKRYHVTLWLLENMSPHFDIRELLEEDEDLAYHYHVVFLLNERGVDDAIDWLKDAIFFQTESS